MGATVGNLVIMLCKDFTNLIIVSLCVGFPISWYLVNEYLSDYAFRTEINWSIYIFTSLFMLLITFLSIGYQSVKASTSNPVDSLRNE